MKEENLRQKQIFDIYYSLKDRSLEKLFEKLKIKKMILFYLLLMEFIKE